MAIVSERPTHGMRVRLVLRHGTRMYEGAATTATAQWDVRVEVDATGTPTVDTKAAGSIAEYVRRVVRIAARDATDEGLPLPRVIQRWRAKE